MGENYGTCGFASLQDFDDAMFESEARQLEASVEFVIHDRCGNGWKFLKHADHR